LLLELAQLNPVVIAAYIEQHPAAAPTVKQHLAALRMLFDSLVLGQIIPVNPASSVRGPRHVVKKRENARAHPGGDAWMRSPPPRPQAFEIAL
jgi:hypothetical protein